MRILARVAVLLGAFVLLVAAEGCTMADWHESRVYDNEPHEVYEAFLKVIREKHPEYMIEVANPEELLLETTWFANLAPAGLHGHRTKIQVEVEQREYGTVARMRIPKETNTNMESPMDEEEADWWPRGNDEDLEAMVFFQASRELLKTSAGDEFLDRYRDRSLPQHYFDMPLFSEHEGVQDE